jgi:uncharacterized phage infection (PIP) family protein YhgE
MKGNVKILSKYGFFTFLSVAVLFSPFNTLSIQETTHKEEVVYAILQHTGVCEEIYIVNHFVGIPPVVEYGNYEWVRNLTNTTPLSIQDDSVKISTQETDFYYEGKTKANGLPWSISLAYAMNGEPISPSDLGGRNGKLNITITIEPSKYPNTFFHENYAMQVVLTLHADKCKNIHSPGATIIRAGKENQITYTILPGSQWTKTISANVSNFEMKPIMIHGMQLTFPIDINQFPISTDVSRFQDSIRDLQKGADLLSDGANDLTQGVGEVSNASHRIHENSHDFQNGFQLLADGIFEMQNNIFQLENHFLALQNGSSQILDSLQQIDQQLQEITLQRYELEILVEASLEMQDGIQELSENTKKLADCIQYSYYREQIRNQGLDIEDLVQWNTDAASQIEEQIEDLTSIYEELKEKPGFYDVAQRIADQILQLKDLKILLDGNNSVHYGTKVFFEESSSSLAELERGMRSLENNYNEFHSSILLLTQTLSGLFDDMHDLSSSIHDLATQYEEMDQATVDVSAAFTEMSQGCTRISHGIMELLQETKAFSAGTTRLITSSSDLLKGTVELKNGTSEMKAGVTALNKETKNLDRRVQKQIDDVIGSITGETIQPLSFASKKNGPVQSVQFHIRTHEIYAPKPIPIHSKQNRPKTFWEKLLDLFGLQ